MKEKLGIQNKFVILKLASKLLNKSNEITFNNIVSKLNTDEVLVLIGCTEEQKNSLPANIFGLGFIEKKSCQNTIQWQIALPTHNMKKPLVLFQQKLWHVEHM